MLSSNLRKWSIWLGIITAVILFAVIALRSHKNITDEDTWFHLRVGEYIVHHNIPKVDIFTCSVAGKPWNNHEWLWQTILYSVYRFFGQQGVVCLETLLICAILTIIFFLGYKKSWIFPHALLIFMILANQHAEALLRPQFVSLLFMLIYLVLLWRFLKWSWTIKALFVLQVLWTNIHGFFIFGPIMVLVLITSEFIRRHMRLPYEWNTVGIYSDQDYRRLKIISAFLIFACFINPQFIDGAWYPIKVMLDSGGDAKFFYSFVGELHRPVYPSDFMMWYLQPIYKLFFILSLAGFVLNRRRIDLRVLLSWFLFLCFSLAAVRNVIFFEIVAYLSIVVNAASLISRKTFIVSRFKNVWGYSILIIFEFILIFKIVSYGRELITSTYIDPVSYQSRSILGQLSTQRFPLKAQNFLIQNQVTGNFFNNVEAGLRLIAKNYPDIKIYISGTTELYGADFFKQYLKIFEDGDWELFEDQVDKNNITGVFISMMDKPASTKFLKKLYYNPGWKLVYFDDDALIFLKDVALNRDIIINNKVDLTVWSTKPVDPKVLNYSPYANTYYFRAVVLNYLDLPEKALNELSNALKIDPAHAKALRLREQIYSNIGVNSLVAAFKMLQYVKVSVQ